MDGYFSGDKDAISDVHVSCIFLAILFAFEKGMKRQLLQCVQLIHALIKRRVITKDEMKKGLFRLCSKFDEISLDIPVASNHFAYILAEILVKRYLNLSQICGLFTSTKRKNTVVIILNALSHIEDEKTLISVYKSCMSHKSGQCLINLLPVDNRSQESLNKMIQKIKCLSPLFPYLVRKE